MTIVYFIKKRIIEVFGLSLLMAGLLLALSLINYDSFDPSSNVAIAGTPHNILGIDGAYFADIFMQGFGHFSYIIVFVLCIWGINFFIHRSWTHFWLRAIALPIMVTALGMNSIILSLPVVLGCIPQAILNIFSYDTISQPITPTIITLATLSFFVLSFTIIVISGLTWHEIKSLGSLFKSFINLSKSLKSKLYWHNQNFSPADRVKNFSSSIGYWSKFTAFINFKSKVKWWPLLSDSQNVNSGSYNKEPVFFNHEQQSSSSHTTNYFTANTYKNQPTDNAAIDFDIERPKLNEEIDSNLNHRPSDNLKPMMTTSSANGRRKEIKPSAFSKQQSPLELSAETTYQLPPLNLLKTSNNINVLSVENDQQLQDNARQLMGVLEEFGVKGQITKVRPGPVVTLYELVPAAGVKTARVVGLADDIARSMCALSARISVIPGQNALGIELPNKSRQTVLLQELMTNSYFENESLRLALALGKDISGAPVLTDLARMPHLLVAGTTGSGKSVAINTMILSLLYRLSPESCRFIMIDPKMLELSVYDGIPHLLTPVVTEPKKAIYALKWTVREMEDRYRAMSRLGVRNIEGYNARLKDAVQRNETLTRQVQTGYDAQTGQVIYETQPLNSEPLPYIVVVVDEMADLMMVAGKEIEAAVQRLAQMARAAGIHLIMATQRPSVDVITGTIKANFPTRISFQVTSRFDSRTILGEQGAEQLLGRGDMLFMEAGGKIQRIHGPFVTDEEVNDIVSFLKNQGTPQYIDTITEDAANTPLDSFDTGETSKDDQLYQQAVALVQREGKASTSFVQRHLRIGYNNAARIIEQMEAQGIISSANHVGKREVLING